ARFLHTEEVTGSIPVSPTTEFFGAGPQRGRRFVVLGPRSGPGAPGGRPEQSLVLQSRPWLCAPRPRDRSGAALPLGRSSSAASDRMLSTSIQ
ncbi:MAG: hypothetical protein D8B55_06215, partial [Actinomyces sp.]